MSSAHMQACPGSRSLCDLLFEALAGRVPNLERVSTKQWCGYFSKGYPRFAYIAHRKRSQSLEVWCSGDADQIRSFLGSAYRERETTRSGWEEKFPGRFRIQDVAEIELAVAALHGVSYAASRQGKGRG